MTQYLPQEQARLGLVALVLRSKMVVAPLQIGVPPEWGQELGPVPGRADIILRHIARFHLEMANLEHLVGSKSLYLELVTVRR